MVRNPNWSRDEIILVGALVDENGWRTIAQEDRRAIDLSRLLQTTAIHPLTPRLESFRNPAAVERKSSDLVSRHPSHTGVETNGSRLDREVVDDFLSDAARMRSIARTIREALEAWDQEPPEVDLDLGPEPEAKEGGVLAKLQLRRERDPKLRQSKIDQARRRGQPLACEACGFDFARAYGDRGLDYIEVHHRTPLSVSGPVTSRLDDLAFVCSNCHRMIHRTRRWLTVEELHDVVTRQRHVIDLATPSFPTQVGIDRHLG